MQDPAAPIFEAARGGEGSHDAGRVITGLREVVHYRAAAIDQNLFLLEQLGHVQPPPSNASLSALAAERADAFAASTREAFSARCW